MRDVGAGRYFLKVTEFKREQLVSSSLQKKKLRPTEKGMCLGSHRPF